MNPDNNQPHSFDLPLPQAPQSETLTPAAGDKAVLPIPGEQAPTLQGNGAVPAVPPASANPVIPPVPMASPQNSQSPAGSTDNDDLAADDADLIEKEWVVKAKQIVEQTKNDPYVQNKQITRMKADYIKKRYNKDLKVGDE